MYAIMGNPLTSTPIAPVYMPMLQLIHLANVRGLRMPLSMTSQRCKNIQNQKLYIYHTSVQYCINISYLHIQHIVLMYNIIFLVFTIIFAAIHQGNE